MNTRKRKIDLYINGQILSIDLDRHDDADAIIAMWTNSKFGIENDFSFTNYIELENGMLRINCSNCNAYIDIKSIDAIRCEH